MLLILRDQQFVNDNFSYVYDARFLLLLKDTDAGFVVNAASALLRWRAGW